MRKKGITALLLLSVSILAAYVLLPSDESRIRKLFREGARAAESMDFEGVMAKVSFNYRDDYGMTYLSLKEMLKREFQGFSDISIEYGDLKVQVREDLATVEMDLRVMATAGGETGYIAGDIRTPLCLRFILGKERAKWQIVRTESLRPLTAPGSP
jgi:hypothetical protein